VPLEHVYSSSGAGEDSGKKEVGGKAIEAAKKIAGKKAKACEFAHMAVFTSGPARGLLGTC
jgi:hypothetical protein